MNVNVKICGIRSIESALAAIDAGADFIGLNFVQTSKRKVTLEQAKAISAAVKGQIKIVGVFQDAEVSFVNDTASKVDLDFVQLHGDEEPPYYWDIKSNIIKAIFTEQQLREINIYDVPFFLLDREVQGEGKMVNPEIAKRIAHEFEIFLAGGLTPENVAEVVMAVKPFAVDVAGGIETNGKEDHEKIRQFVLNAKGVSYE